MHCHYWGVDMHIACSTAVQSRPIVIDRIDEYQQKFTYIFYRSFLAKRHKHNTTNAQTHPLRRRRIDNGLLPRTEPHFTPFRRRRPHWREQRLSVNPCRPGGDGGVVGGELRREREATISRPLHLSLCSSDFLLKPVVH